MNKTVLILGAGASIDYGYPLWADLRKQLIELELEKILEEEISNLSDNDRNAHTQAHIEFLKMAHEKPEYTLDRIIYEIDKPKERHLNPIGHLLINFVGHFFAKVEMQNTNGQWITDLQKVLVEHIALSADARDFERNHLDNLTIASLNYDRSFPHFICNNFFKRLVNHEHYDPPDMPYSVKLSNSNRLKIFRPHGYICGLGSNNKVGRPGMNLDLPLVNSSTSGIRYPGNDQAVAYADDQITKKDCFLRMGKHMYVVDERGDSDYQLTNNAIKSADLVFRLGLSKEGICQSSFKFKDSQRVYLSNKGAEVEKIEECKPGPEYFSLGTADVRLDAKEFVPHFKRLVFFPVS